MCWIIFILVILVIKLNYSPTKILMVWFKKCFWPSESNQRICKEQPVLDKCKNPLYLEFSEGVMIFNALMYLHLLLSLHQSLTLLSLSYSWLSFWNGRKDLLLEEGFSEIPAWIMCSINLLPLKTYVFVIPLSIFDCSNCLFAHLPYLTVMYPRAETFFFVFEGW